MLFITKPLSAIIFVAMIGGMYLFLSSQLPEDRGEVISNERVQATVLESTTVESDGRYTGKSFMHMGRVELSNGDEYRVYFPTKPIVGDTVPLQLREFADGSFDLHHPGPDDF